MSEKVAQMTFGGLSLARARSSTIIARCELSIDYLIDLKKSNLQLVCCRFPRRLSAIHCWDA